MALTETQVDFVKAFKECGDAKKAAIAIGCKAAAAAMMGGKMMKNKDVQAALGLVTEEAAPTTSEPVVAPKEKKPAPPRMITTLRKLKSEKNTKLVPVTNKPGQFETVEIKGMRRGIASLDNPNTINRSKQAGELHLGDKGYFYIADNILFNMAEPYNEVGVIDESRADTAVIYKACRICGALAYDDYNLKLHMAQIHNIA